MFLTALTTAVSAPKTYYIGTNYYAWVLPATEITGLILQAISIYFKNIFLLVGGLLLVTLFAVAERDITLITGDFLASTGIMVYLIKSKKDV